MLRRPPVAGIKRRMQRRTLLAVLAGAAAGLAIVLSLSLLDHGHARPGVVTARHHPRLRLPVVGEVAVAARYLGIGRAQVRAALRSGRTLGELAESVPGHSARGLIVAIVVARELALEERVRTGRLAPALARRQSAHLLERVTDAVLGRGRPVPQARD
jgi:hypothetical protein